MPRTKRQNLLRIHDQGVNDLDRHLENIRSLEMIYEEHHPEISEQLRNIAKFIINYQENIWNRFRDEVM